MDRIQTFKTPGGEELVIMPKADYDRLMSHQDDDDVAAARKALRRVKAGTEPLIPLEVYKLIRQKHMPRIRAWRTYRGMSSADLAKKIGKSHSYLVQLENGARKGTLETMSLLADKLGTTLDGLRD